MSCEAGRRGYGVMGFIELLEFVGFIGLGRRKFALNSLHLMP